MSMHCFVTCGGNPSDNCVRLFFDFGSKMVAHFVFAIFYYRVGMEASHWLTLFVYASRHVFYVYYYSTCSSRQYVSKKGVLTVICLLKNKPVSITLGSKFIDLWFREL